MLLQRLFRLLIEPPGSTHRRARSMRAWAILAAAVFAGPIATAGLAAGEEPWIVGLPEGAPHAHLNPEGGEPQGYLVDFWRAAGEVLGAEVVFRLGAYDELLEWLRAGEIDLHGGLQLGGLAPPEVDSGALILGMPVSVRCQSLFFVAGSPALSALEGKRVGMLPDMLAADPLGGLGAAAVPLSSVPQGLEALRGGELDYVLGPDRAPGPEQIRSRQLHCPWLVPAVRAERAGEPVAGALAAAARVDGSRLEQRWRTASGVAVAPPGLEVTQEQLRWLAGHSSIRLGASPWVPMTEVTEEGLLTGLGLETVRTVFQKIGVLPIFASQTDWRDAIAQAMDGETDGLGYTLPSAEREQTLRFTKPLVSPDFAIANRIDAPFVRGLGDLAGARLAVIEDYEVLGALRRDHPEVELVEVRNAEAGLRLLSSGGVEAYLDILPAITQLTNRLGIKNLKMAARLDLTSSMSCGVRRDWPELVELLDRSIEQTSEADLQRIYEAWDRVHIEPRASSRRAVLATAGLVASPLLVWIFLQARRTVRQRQEAERKESMLQNQVIQLQKLEAVGTLARGVAHDFNNILTAILGYADLATLDLPKDAEGHESLRRIVASATRAQDLVSRLRAFSHSQTIEGDTVDLALLAREAAKLLRASLPATVRIETELPAKSAWVHGNASQIQQALMNLASNAADAMPDGGLLAIRLRSMKDAAGTETITGPLAAGRYFQLSVEDEGVGIEPEDLPKIFDPFFTTRPVGAGTGLGLSTVHGIVSAHQGGILVDSERGRGSRFEIYLPVSEPPSGALPALEHAAAPGRKDGCQRILIVDDEPYLTDVVGRCLEGMGYTTRCFNVSLEALEAFEDTPQDFDLIVSDLTMPHLTGEELATRATAIRPDIPVILMTGYSSQVVQEKVAQGTIRQVLEKPMKPQELIDAVGRQLDQQTPPSS
ncbi:MAG: transporter substrate-binding domain-containing protein [Acidobacteriota bacterium]